MSNPRYIHQAILDHRESDVFTALKIRHNVNSYCLNEIQYPHGLTPLQLAAREGMIEVSLWLVLAGAEIDKITPDLKHSNNPLLNEQATKSPLYLALERGHTLLAAVLLSMGADQKQAFAQAKKLGQDEISNQLRTLKLDPDVIKPLLYKAVASSESEFPNKTHLLERLLPQWDQCLATLPSPDTTISRLVELASYQSAKDISETLRKKYKTQSDPEIRTAGYWAAIQGNGKDFFQKVCSEDEEVQITLRQLVEEAPAKYSEYCKLVTPTQQEQFNKFFSKDESIVHQRMSRQDKLYNFLARGDRTNFTNFFIAEKDIGLLPAAFKKNDFVVLQQLQMLDILKYSPDLDRSLALFVLLSLGISYRQSSAMKELYGLKGCLYQEMIGEVKKTTISEVKTSVPIPHFDADTFLLCMHDRFPDADYLPLMTSSSASLQKRLDDSNLCPKVYVLRAIIERAALLGVNIQFKLPAAKNNTVKKLEDVRDLEDITNHRNVSAQILQFLSVSDQKALSVCSKAWYRTHAKINSRMKLPGFESEETLDRRYNAVQQFITQLEKEIKNKSCFSHRECCGYATWGYADLIFLMLLLIFTPLTALSVDWLVTVMLPQGQRIRNQMGDTVAGHYPYPDNQKTYSCRDFLFNASPYSCSDHVVYYTPDIPRPPICDPYCSQLDALMNPIGALCITGSVVGGILVLTALCIVLCRAANRSCFRHAQDNRFHHLTLNDYSDDTRQQFKDMQDEFKESPFKDLAKGDVGPLLKRAREVRASLEVKRTVLYDGDVTITVLPATLPHQIGLYGSINADAGTSRVMPNLSYDEKDEKHPLVRRNF